VLSAFRIGSFSLSILSLYCRQSTRQSLLVLLWNIRRRDAIFPNDCRMWRIPPVSVVCLSNWIFFTHHVFALLQTIRWTMSPCFFVEHATCRCNLSEWMQEVTHTSRKFYLAVEKLFYFIHSPYSHFTVDNSYMESLCSLWNIRCPGVIFPSNSKVAAAQTSCKCCLSFDTVFFVTHRDIALPQTTL
jgi:hypothetical protein